MDKHTVRVWLSLNVSESIKEWFVSQITQNRPSLRRVYCTFPDGKKQPPSPIALKEHFRFVTNFERLENAEHTIDSTRRGEEYWGRMECECYLQNGITNIVSRLDDLVAASITALRLFQSMGKEQVLQHLRPMRDCVPDRYKEFVSMQQKHFESSPNCQLTQISEAHTEDAKQATFSPENRLSNSPVNEADAIKDTSGTVQTFSEKVELTCCELHDKTNLSNKKIEQILETIFGKDCSCSESYVRGCIQNPSKPSNNKRGRKPNKDTHSFLAYNIDTLEIFVCCDLSCYKKT